MDKCCPKTGKVCYTQREAGNAIRVLKKHNVHKNKKLPCRYYYCKECGWYHLTHYRNPYPSKKWRYDRYDNNTH